MFLTHQKQQFSLFDFQGDGQVDILYRDQDNLRILSYDGTSTLQDIVAAVPCTSTTTFEHPMAVDITGDGQTELVCDCDGKIKAFGSSNPNVPLMPSRKVWNQWSYFVVNINDDLTVPRYQQNHSVNKGINAYWQQLPLWDPVTSQPVRAAADVTLTIDSLNCSYGFELNTVHFTVTNIGSGTYPADSYVSYYDGDPMLAGSTYLGRVQLNTLLAQGDTENGIVIVDDNPTLDLFLVVNDDGTASLPYATPPNTNIECDFLNNNDYESPIVCLPTDSDSDGIPDYVDLDDDNDGIDDLEESDCGTSSLNLVHWSANSAPGDQATIADPSYIASANNVIFGAGLGGSVSGTLFNMTDIDQADLGGAITNDDYMEFSFTMQSGISGIYLKALTQNKHPSPSAIPSNYGYDLSIIVSNNCFE